MSLDNFICFDLEVGVEKASQKLIDVITGSQQKKGVYVLYGNASWFEEGSSSNLLSLISKQLNNNKSITKLETDSDLNLTDDGLHVISGKFSSYSNLQNNAEQFSFLRALPGAVRKAALAGTFNNATFILLAPPICYDFFNRADESLLGALDIAHEYLLTADDGSAEQTISFKQAWRGNGFAGWRFRKYHSNATTEFPYPSRFHEVLDNTLEKLQFYEQLLKHNHTLDNIHEYGQNGFLDALIDFLPAYRHDNELIATNSRGPKQPEGPVIWEGILELDYHQRQLLLDGLLTLWPYPQKSGDYLLQPASLALLYWAARRLQYTHSAAGTEKFMKCYFDYPPADSGGEPLAARKCLGWFGGKLATVSPSAAAEHVEDGQ